MSRVRQAELSELLGRPVVRAIVAFVRSLQHDAATGHDPWHLQRVCHTALILASEESHANPDLHPDVEIIACAAWLHDIVDHKFTEDFEVAAKLDAAAAVLASSGMGVEQIHHVLGIVQGVSFQGASVATPMATLEGACVQDADRMDALGAVGIARCFAYGGSKGRLLYDPDHRPERHTDFSSYRKSQSASLNHFHEKLYLLRDRMQTQSGRAMAAERHAFLQEFERRFLAEWNAN